MVSQWSTICKAKLVDARLRDVARHIQRRRKGMFFSELHFCVALRALGSRLQWTGGSRRLTPPAVRVSPYGLMTNQKTEFEKEQDSFRRSLRQYQFFNTPGLVGKRLGGSLSFL